MFCKIFILDNENIILFRNFYKELTNLYNMSLRIIKVLILLNEF